VSCVQDWLFSGLEKWRLPLANSMRDSQLLMRKFLMLLFIELVAITGFASAQTNPSATTISTSDLDVQIREFLKKEISAHVKDIKTLAPPPDRIVGALTTGEFSWGTFMRTLGAYSEFSGARTIDGRDVPQMIGQMAQVELSRGGKAWAQLYAAMALESFGKDLTHNALWQELSAEQRKTYLVLLDPNRFYDSKSHKLLNLPENYFGVAARIAAIDYELGLSKNRVAMDELLDHAAAQFTKGALFADDAPPTGRYDRYSNEYTRALYEAAQLAGREDILKAVSPSLKEQMKLWWDLLAPDGYGYSWGRSLGAISYMDTMEISAFLGQHAEFRPAPLSQLASAYFAAWSWLRRDFNDQTHLLSIFAFGRGDYGYITKEREWQQTTTFLAKVINAHEKFIPVLQKEGVNTFPSQLDLPDVARFQFFRDGPGRKFGVWVVRQGGVQFALPFVTGPKAATSDYEPAPHGFPGFSVPVEKIYPCLVPFLELEDGRTIAALDGADEIKISEDGKSLTTVWRRWVRVGATAGETVDPGLTSEVTWFFKDNSLRRVETLTAGVRVKIRRLWLAIPTQYNRLETREAPGARIDRLSSGKGMLEIQVKNPVWPFSVSALATGDDPLGRGDRGPIPLHLILESTNLSIEPGAPARWEVFVSVN
jgi:hypothetical protein